MLSTVCPQGSCPQPGGSASGLRPPGDSRFQRQVPRQVLRPPDDTDFDDRSDDGFDAGGLQPLRPRPRAPRDGGRACGASSRSGPARQRPPAQTRAPRPPGGHGWRHLRPGGGLAGAGGALAGGFGGVGAGSGADGSASATGAIGRRGADRLGITAGRRGSLAARRVALARRFGRSPGGRLAATATGSDAVTGRAGVVDRDG